MKDVSFIHMMQNKLAALICLVFLVMTMIGCGHRSQISEKLDVARQKMEESPDSALMVLQDISSQELHNAEDRALYGMLYVQAMDKNHLDPDNDSIIAQSVDYYTAHEKLPEQIISTYYRGRALYHAGNYPQSLLCFYKAKELAEDNGEYFWAGMSCRGISDVYKLSYHSKEQLIYAEKEFYYIKKSGKQPYLNYALYDYSWALRNFGDTKSFNKAIKICDQLVDSAKKFDDPYLYSAAIQMKAVTLVGTGRYKEALPVIIEVCDDEFVDSSDSLYLSLALFENGRHREAKELLDTVSDCDTLLRRLIHSRFERAKGNWDIVLNDALFLTDKADSVAHLSMRMIITTPLSDYYYKNRELDNIRINSYRKRNLLLSAIVLLITIIAVMIVYKLRVRQVAEINDRILLADRLSEEIERFRVENSKTHDIVETMLPVQYKLLEQLTEIAVKTNDNRKVRKNIADAVTKLIEDLSIGGDKLKELEDKVDSLYNNVYSDFKRALPNLKEADYLLFLFSALGISSTTISVFLKEGKIEAVYNRKRRLKDKIRQLDSSQSDRYLKYL